MSILGVSRHIPPFGPRSEHSPGARQARADNEEHAYQDSRLPARHRGAGERKHLCHDRIPGHPSGHPPAERPDSQPDAHQDRHGDADPAQAVQHAGADPGGAAAHRQLPLPAHR